VVVPLRPPRALDVPRSPLAGCERRRGGPLGGARPRALEAVRQVAAAREPGARSALVGVGGVHRAEDRAQPEEAVRAVLRLDRFAQPSPP
jgi:hypothetical protein